MATTYAQAGVSRGKAAQATKLFMPFVKATHNRYVLDSESGSFAPSFDFFAYAKDYGFKDPIKITTVDGTGTIPLLSPYASDSFGSLKTFGKSMFHHFATDAACSGARDWTDCLNEINTNPLYPQVVAAIVEGICAAAKEVGCAVIGGETAELPGAMVEGTVVFSISGTAIGERADRLPKPFGKGFPVRTACGRFQEECFLVLVLGTDFDGTSSQGPRFFQGVFSKLLPEADLRLLSFRLGFLFEGRQPGRSNLCKKVRPD